MKVRERPGRRLNPYLRAIGVAQDLGGRENAYANLLMVPLVVDDEAVAIRQTQPDPRVRSGAQGKNRSADRHDAEVERGLGDSGDHLDRHGGSGAHAPFAQSERGGFDECGEGRDAHRTVIAPAVLRHQEVRSAKSRGAGQKGDDREGERPRRRAGRQVFRA